LYSRNEELQEELLRQKKVS